MTVNNEHSPARKCPLQDTRCVAPSPRRPDAQLIEGGQRQEEEQQLNRELPDDIVRRQLIHNLAKHVIFSKDTANTAAACGFTSDGFGYYCVTATDSYCLKFWNH